MEKNKKKKNWYIYLTNARQGKTEQWAPTMKNGSERGANPWLDSRFGEKQINPQPNIHIQRVNKRRQRNPLHSQIHIRHQKIRNRQMNNRNTRRDYRIRRIQPLRPQKRPQRDQVRVRQQFGQREQKIRFRDFANDRFLPEPLENGLDVEPEEGHGARRQEEEDDSFEVGLGEDGPPAGPEGLAADGVHAGAEALHDGEAGDVGEAHRQ